jgi:hypothetical protein
MDEPPDFRLLAEDTLMRDFICGLPSGALWLLSARVIVSDRQFESICRKFR